MLVKTREINFYLQYFKSSNQKENLPAKSAAAWLSQNYDKTEIKCTIYIF